MPIDIITIPRIRKTYYKPALKTVSMVLKQPIASSKNSAASSKIPLLSDIPNLQQSAINIKKLGNLINNILSKKTYTKEEEAELKQLIQTELYNLKKKVMGNGFHESVYEIDENYAAKFHPDEYASTVISPDDNLQIFKNEYSGLERYFGGVLARFGNFKILKNLGQHVPAGIPQKLNRNFSTEYYRKKYLPVFAKVPQQSYNELLQDCARLNERHNSGYDFYCHIFDYINPNNIVLKDDKLYWVDLIRSDASEKNAIMRILNLMLNKYDIGGSAWIFDGFGEALDYARCIFKKIIIAGATVNMPLRSNFDMFSNKIIRNILNNLKIEKEPEIVVADLERILKNKNKEERIKETENYLATLIK